MSREIANTFSWSASRGKAFETCRRRYFLSYYASWNGWRRDGPADAQRAYLLKKLDNRYSWRGRIAHATIQKWQHAGCPTSTEPFILAAHAVMRSDYAASKARVAKPAQKLRADFFGLVEHELDEQVTREEWAAVWQQTKGKLEWFFASEWAECLRGVTKDAVLAVDDHNFDAQQFLFEGTRVYALPDFAFIDGDGRCQTVDYKSGRAREEDKNQVVGYAKFLAEKFGAPTEKTTINLVYLGKGTARVDVTSADVEAWESSTRSSIRQMKELLVDVEKNVPRPMEAFPMTTDLRECGRCSFRNVCGRSAAREAA